MIKLLLVIAFIWLDFKIFDCIGKYIFFPNKRRQDKEE